MALFQPKSAFALLFACLFFISCEQKNKPSDVKTTSSDTTFTHPDWSSQSNIYEVNLRQYSSAGTVNEFKKHLPRLKEMGVEILWFMPITPIGVEGRKMKASDLGSYYAVKDYKGFNSEFGTMEDWKNFVKEAHSMGFKVIIDWVGNHSAPDNPWMTSHPDFYAKDSAGNVIIPFDWTDTRKLNYNNPELRDSMIEAMKFWVRESDIDGFRCDVASEVPDDFWKQCISSLRELKHVFMLAEGDKPELHWAGFDETYAWNEFSVIANIFSGKKSLASLDSVINYVDTAFPKNAYRMYFTTNHDENSWNGTEFERMGPGYKAFAVWTQTMVRSVPLIYSGQEVANKRRLKFFEKDTIAWGNYVMADFYKTLLHLRKKTKALAADASFRKLSTGVDQSVYAYVREKDGQKVVVILNLSAKPQKFRINDDVITGNPMNIFMAVNEKVDKNLEFSIEPWGYIVYDY